MTVTVKEGCLEALEAFEQDREPTRGVAVATDRPATSAGGHPERLHATTEHYPPNEHEQYDHNGLIRPKQEPVH